jgi:hypothetical protein
LAPVPPRVASPFGADDAPARGIAVPERLLLAALDGDPPRAAPRDPPPESERAMALPPLTWLAEPEA